AIARCTVAGPARCAAINSRTDGSREPGAAPDSACSSATATRSVLPSIMKKASNATAVPRVTQAALAYGLLGTLAFSFSLPATREAVEDLDPTFVGLGRALVAATLAALLLAIRREAIPPSKDWPRFAVVGVGVVVGFPLFSSLALKHLTTPT